ncbi:MAG: hypothetical protein HY744_19015 [Deltaproteobacteria bacterium]|nr:hypothetical protein [Deltaproteobacteria bacterium]
MFRILEDQMARLGAETRQKFVAMMTAYLGESFPAWVGALSATELEAWVERALGKAEQHGVTTEPEAAQLILLFAVLGLDADEDTPWVRDVLADRDLAALGKVRALAARAREHAVQGIEHALVYDWVEG